ncbi:MAG: response regulator [Acidimicrobiia bacterium]|nr:response regulator [Acidimicrobiia bacterium]
MTQRILFVDDEVNVLDGFRRTLRREYEFDTAVGGHEGLDMLAQHEYAVVVSDMRMPKMSGEDFLAKAYQEQPDAVQMILSGQANLDSTVAAVNGGNIFRFLIKPLEKVALCSALDKALAQYGLVTAERELLEQTLSGAVEALTEVVGLVSPQVTKRTRHVVEIVEQVSPVYRLGSDWQMRLTALLSGIGYAAVPGPILEKAERGESLTEAESAMLSRHPDVTAELLGHIPRMEGVSSIIRAAAGAEDPPDGLEEHVSLLAFANRVADGLLRGTDIDSVFDEIAAEGGHDPELIDGARRLSRRDGTVVANLAANELFVGAWLRQDVFTVNDVMLASAGTAIGQSLLERLRNFDASIGIVAPIKVEYVPTRSVGLRRC